MKKILVFILFISQFSFAQDINYEQEDYYYIKRTKHLKVLVEKGELTIENDILEQAAYPTANKLYFANDNIHFDSFRHIKDIVAYTELPNSTEKLNVDHFETKDMAVGNIFYSDSKLINFVFPGVTKGAKTTLKYKEIVDEPHFSTTFTFASGVPIKESVFIVEVDKNVELGYKTFNTEEFNITFEKIEERKSTKYIWKSEHINAFNESANNLSLLEFIPHVIVYIKSYKTSRKPTIVYNTLDDLYSWNASLNKQIDRSNLNEVHKIADDLTKDLTSEKEKANAIFNWVQENINYVAFEYGYGGLIPRGAAQVCNNRYGDCKDMSNLLYEMLIHVGINAHHTWIGSRDKPYTHEQIPTGSIYNHMITTAIIDDEVIYLDATDNFVPFGMPSSFIQGKEGMIGLSEDEYKIATVSEQEKEKSTTTIFTEVEMNGTTLNAKGKRVLTGYDLVDFIYDFYFDRTDKTDEQFLSEQLIVGNNKTTFSNINFDDYERQKNAYEFSYDMEINNYARQIGSKIFLNLNLEKPLSNSIVQLENQLYGKRIDHKYVRTYHTTFKVPEGYKVSSIPKEINNEQDDYGFCFKFTQEDQIIKVEKQIYINTLAIYNEDLEAYNSFVKSLIKAYKKSVVLEKIN